MNSTDDLPLTVAWFETAMPDGSANGDPETLLWSDFASIISDSRREGDKDGPNFVPSRFKLGVTCRFVQNCTLAAVSNDPCLSGEF